MNGYRYAELGPMERLSSPDTCDCCGREGLKRTIKLISPAGRPVWFGCGCAAKAMGRSLKEVNKARKDAIDAARDAEWKAKQAASWAHDLRWQAFLDKHVPGKERIDQIQALGGMPTARAMFRAEGGAS